MKVPANIPTERLLLRHHCREDLEPFAAFMEDREATRFMPFSDQQRSAEGARQLLEYVIQSYDSDDAVFSLTIASPDSNAFLGSCGIHPLPDEDAVEMYYAVLPAYQGHGIATEAGRVMIRYLFENTDIDRIVAFVAPRNLSSVRICEKLGFVDDGPVERPAAAGLAGHQAAGGRRYLLQRDGTH